jgi:hypothetical protein
MNTVSVEKYDLAIEEPPFLTNQVGTFTYTDEEMEQAIEGHGKDCACSVLFHSKVANMGYWMQFFTSGGDDYAFKVVVWDKMEDYYNHILPTDPMIW